MLKEIWKIYTYQSIKSTMDEAVRLIGQEEQFVVMAYSQSHGRGRYDRQWISPSGNLYATLAFKPLQSCPTWGQISFVAALAVGEVIQQYFSGYQGDEKLTYKWPNDILISGQKVSGILLEIINSSWLLIGIGLNLQSSPKGLKYPSISLREAGARIPLPEEALTLLTHHFTTKMNFFEAKGFSKIKEEWLKKAASLGKEIEVSLQRQGKIEKIKGKFMDLDEEGRLLLELASKEIKKISAGDIFLL